jgi:hypothetical protein
MSINPDIELVKHILDETKFILLKKTLQLNLVPFLSLIPLFSFIKQINRCRTTVYLFRKR